MINSVARPLRSFLADLGRERDTDRIQLGRFPRDELAGLLRAVLDREPEAAERVGEGLLPPEFAG